MLTITAIEITFKVFREVSEMTSAVHRLDGDLHKDVLFHDCYHVRLGQPDETVGPLDHLGQLHIAFLCSPELVYYSFSL
jgi:hypothetical protein